MINNPTSRTPVVFLDLQAQEVAERKRCRDRVFMLQRIKDESDGTLRPDLADELDAKTKQLKKADVIDPFFKAVEDAMTQTNQNVGDHLLGILPVMSNSDELVLAAVAGLLLRDHQTNPELGQRFVKAVWAARGEYFAQQKLFDAVYPVLLNEGQKISSREKQFQPYLKAVEIEKGLTAQPLTEAVNKLQDPRRWIEISAEQWAGVVRALAADSVTAGDPLVQLRAREALSNLAGADEGAAPSSLEIDLPDLEAASEVDIVVDNLKATQAIYFTAMLEELRLFQVVDKLVELFQLGMLPVGKGKAGDLLYKYWKQGATRIGEGERRSIYARAFGMPGGDEAQGMPNREFNDLFLRFVSAVSSFVRQFKVDSLLRSKMPVVVSQEQVRKSGRDLAANLSLHGYGIAWFVATELQNQVKEFITLLSDPELKASYGARDMWQVVDQVAALELGGARNSMRYRTMANAGAVIIRWLANHANELSSSAIIDILDMDELARPMPRAQGVKATTSPTDTDLVNACEQWLAVTGTPDQRVEEYSQPVEGPNMTSRPIQIPAAARDLLESVGVQAGLPAYGRAQSGHTNGRNQH